MGRELQKRKRRSGRAPVRQPNKSKKILNPRGNTVIAQNWDKKETLAQNYRRLGLVARLKAPTGGTEKKIQHPKPTAAAAARKDGHFAIQNVEKAIISEARVERDADGKIIRVLGYQTTENPLNDPLNSLDSDDEVDDAAEDADEWGGIDGDDEPTDVVKSLIEDSRNPAPKKVRHQSEGEREWLEKLVARHGDDARSMARDFRLNPMQQTAADISRRIKKMRQNEV